MHKTFFSVLVKNHVNFLDQSDDQIMQISKNVAARIVSIEVPVPVYLWLIISFVDGNCSCGKHDTRQTPSERVNLSK